MPSSNVSRSPPSRNRSRAGRSGPDALALVSCSKSGRRCVNTSHMSTPKLNTSALLPYRLLACDPLRSSGAMYSGVPTAAVMVMDKSSNVRLLSWSSERPPATSLRLVDAVAPCSVWRMVPKSVILARRLVDTSTLSLFRSLHCGVVVGLARAWFVCACVRVWCMCFPLISPPHAQTHTRPR